MFSSGTLVVIELLLVFGLLLGFCGWQIVSVRRAIAKRKAAEAERRSSERGDPAGPPASRNAVR